jgi:methionyl-tRNA formyltransferase
MRIAFMGTPEFALPALGAVAASGHDLVCVYTQPPRPSGRGGAVRRSPVHDWAAARGVEVRTPARLKGAEVQANFAALNLDLAVVAAYGLLLPPAVLGAPRLGCWNVHASLLPRWRGAAPIQYAIWAGDAATGVTLMQMDAGLDTGPMLATRSLAISARETAGTLHDKLAALGAGMVADALADPGALAPTPQPGDGATHAPRLTRADGVVDWARTAQEIDRQVRALNPWPGARTPGGLKILEAEPAPGHTDAAPGAMLDAAGRVACGGGSVLRIARLHPPGARGPMAPRDAINGGYLSAGSKIR